MAQRKSPADNKTYVRVRDQHGRLWGVNMEMCRVPGGGTRLAPCSLWEPLGWTAPWLPPTQYIRPHPEETNRCVIDYAKCVRDQQRAHDERRQRIRDVGKELHGHTFDEEAAPTRQILDAIGYEEPWAWELAEAARRGDRWVLGQTAKENEKLARYIPKPRKRDDWEFDEDLVDAGEPGTRKRQPAGAGA